MKQFYLTSILQRFTIFKTVLFFIFISTLTACKQKNEKKGKPIIYQKIDNLIIKSKGNEAKKILENYRGQINVNDINELGYFYLYQCVIEPSNFERRSIYADSALSLFTNNELINDYPKLYIRILIEKNEVYINFRKFEEALKNYFIIKSLIDKNKDPLVYATYLNSIAAMFYEQNNTVEAIKYYNEVDSSLRGLENKINSKEWLFYLRQGAINNAGFTYERAGILDSALVFYNKGLNYINQKEKDNSINPNQLNNSKVVFLGNLGGLMAKLGRLDSAEYYLEKSINTKTTPVDLPKNTTYIKLAKVYTQEGKLGKADSIFNLVEDVLSRNKAEEDYKTKVFLQEARSFYYAENGEYSKAFNLLKQVNDSRDSLKKLDNNSSKINLAIKFENYENQQQLKSLEKNNKYKNATLFFAGLIITLLASIAFLIIKTYKQAKVSAIKATANSNKLTIAMNKLEKRNKDYAKMMKVMAHDLKNPLAGMMGVANILLEDYKYPPEETEMLKLIANTGENTIEMITQLLNSGLAIENEELVKEDIDFNQLLKQCCDLLQYRASEKSQHITFISGGPVSLSISREKIWRVFNNLIVNAIKFSPINSEIKVVLERIKKGVRVSIIDQGIGIPEENKEKIFEMFTSAKRHGTLGEQPFGLGLAISKQIIESHHGKIWIENNPEGGTIFHIELP